MSRPRHGPLAAMLLAAATGAPAMAGEQPDTGMTAEEIQAKVDWVNEVESGDFHFWRRWRDRPDAAARQGLRRSFYHPRHSPRHGHG